MFTACGITHPQCCRPVAWMRWNRIHATGQQHRGCIIPQAVTLSSAPEDGQNHRQKRVELIGIINKPLLLHLVGCLLLSQTSTYWCLMMTNIVIIGEVNDNQSVYLEHVICSTFFHSPKLMYSALIYVAMFAGVLRQFFNRNFPLPCPYNLAFNSSTKGLIISSIINICVKLRKQSILHCVKIYQYFII